jgi:hypothetical protein
MLARFAVFITLVALGNLPVSAQRRLAPPRPLKIENAQERQALAAKARALLEEIIVEGATLRLAENRIFVSLSAADALWKSDETRARTLAQQALGQFNALTFEFEPNDPQAHHAIHQRRALREFILRTIAQRDAKLALDFLRASRANRPALENEQDAAQTEWQLEMQLANQVAASDPQLALQVAEESLKRGLTYQTVELWQRLLQKDAKAATRLLDAMVAQLKSSALLSAPQNGQDALNTAFNLLNYLRSISTPRRSDLRIPPQAAKQFLPEEVSQRYRELLDLLVGAALTIAPEHFYNDTLRYPAQNLLVQLKSLLPEVEKNLPARLAALRAKLTQFSQVLPKEQANHTPAWFQMIERATPAEIVALAAKAPLEQRQQYYEQAVWKAVGAQDLAQARRLIEENFPNPQQRGNMLANLERNEINRLAGQEKYEEARLLLARLPAVNERLHLLTQWANALAQKGDEQTARRFLAEAQALLGNGVETRSQVEQQLIFATSLLNLDAARGFEIAEAIIERCNTLIAAASVLDNYEQSNGFREGECYLLQGHALQRFSHGLEHFIPLLARQDFERTVVLLRRWQNNEVRLFTGLTLIRALLSELPGNGVTGSREVVG